MSLAYRISPNVQLDPVSTRPILTTADGGRIAIDPFVLSLWEYAAERDLNKIISTFQDGQRDPLSIRAALACLAQAGLLIRTETRLHTENYTPISGDLISVVIVAFNSQSWLPDCLVSLAKQNYSPLELIIVDNGSAQPAQLSYPSSKLIRLDSPGSLASAFNIGIRASGGKFVLLLNPDTLLEPDAIAHMAAIANRYPDCAAVAAKLRFTWARSFLNGIGNYVGGAYWSTDNGVGHLDLGQFAKTDEIPSACFAASMISRAVWNSVGDLDEAFPLYYEDVEWCYRARLLGYTVHAAPLSIVYHALGAGGPTGDSKGLMPTKLKNVTFGRLRFSVKLLSFPLAARFLTVYLSEDLACMLLNLVQRRGDLFRARASAWLKLARDLPTLVRERNGISERRARSYRDTFRASDAIVPPLTWHGLPELTWDLIVFHYLPMLTSGTASAVPEFQDVDLAGKSTSRSWFAHARLIWKTLGARGFMHRLSRFVQWQLARIK